MSNNLCLRPCSKNNNINSEIKDVFNPTLNKPNFVIEMNEKQLKKPPFSVGKYYCL